jgi:hypothetical protein
MTDELHTPKRPWRVFGIGLAIRLMGLFLIWSGDGSDNISRKAMVVVGVILSVGGITVLRYLLLAEPLSKLGRALRKPSGSVDPPAPVTTPSPPPKFHRRSLIALALLLALCTGLWWNARVKRQGRDAWIARVKDLGIPVHVTPVFDGEPDGYLDHSRKFLAGEYVKVVIDNEAQVAVVLGAPANCPANVQFYVPLRLPSALHNQMEARFPTAIHNTFLTKGP